MTHQKTFSIRASLGFAWNMFKRHSWFLVGATLATLIISMLIGNIADEDTLFGSTIGSLLSFIIGALISISWSTVALRFANNQKVAARDFFSRYEVFWKFLGASVVYMLIVFGGLLLLIVPGIIWAIKYQMFPYIILEKNLSIKAALKESARITNGAKCKLFGFAILSAIINLAGVLAFGIGFLVTSPIIAIANAHIYKSLKDRTQPQGQTADTNTTEEKTFTAEVVS